MIKNVKIISLIAFWLQAFAAPFLLCGIIAFFLYNKNQNSWIAFTLIIAGMILGIVLAEFIRRKYGLETFFSKIYGSPELDEKE